MAVGKSVRLRGGGVRLGEGGGFGGGREIYLWKEPVR